MNKNEITSFFSETLNSKRIPLEQNLKPISSLNQTNPNLSQLEKLFKSIPVLTKYYSIIVHYFQNTDSYLSSYFCSLFILVHKHFYNFPSSSERTTFQNELKSLLLSITSEIESIVRGYQCELFPQNIYEFRIIISIELLLELIATIFMRYFPNSKEIYNESFTVNQIEVDIKNLYILNCSLPWLSNIITAINYIYSISRCKLFLSTQNRFDTVLKSTSIKNKCILKHFDIFNGIICLIRKYSINKRNLLSNPLMNWKYNYTNDTLYDKIYMKDLCIFNNKLIEALNENILVSYKVFERELNINMMSINSFSDLILFSSVIYENMVYVKFKHDNFKVDFHSYFTCFYEFSNSLSKEINKKIMHYIDQLFTYLKVNQHNKNTFPLLNEINLTTINYFHNILKDFLVSHIIASFNSDSFCDCFIKNECLKHVIDLYILISFLKTCFIVYIENNAKMSHSSIIFKIFDEITEDLIQHNEIVFPLRLFIYKETFIQDQLIVINHFVKTFKNELVEHMNNSKDVNLIQTLREISKTQNPYNFYLAYSILRTIQPNNKDNYKIRFYINNSFPLDYYDINYFRNSKTDKSNNNTPTNIDLENKENINSNIIYNNNNKYSKRHSNKQTVHKKRGSVSLNNESLEMEDFDISTIANNLNLSSFKKMQNNSLSYSKVNNKHILTCHSNDLPLVFIQESFGFKQCQLNEKDLLLNLQENIGSKIYIENILQCFLIGDSTGINKENIDATLKYFDCEGEMDYFGLIDQLQKIIV